MTLVDLFLRVKVIIAIFELKSRFLVPQYLIYRCFSKNCSVRGVFVDQIVMNFALEVLSLSLPIILEPISSIRVFLVFLKEGSFILFLMES